MLPRAVGSPARLEQSRTNLKRASPLACDFTKELDCLATGTCYQRNRKSIKLNFTSFQRETAKVSGQWPALAKWIGCTWLYNVLYKICIDLLFADLRFLVWSHLESQLSISVCERLLRGLRARHPKHCVKDQGHTKTRDIKTQDIIEARVCSKQRSAKIDDNTCTQTNGNPSFFRCLITRPIQGQHLRVCGAFDRDGGIALVLVGRHFY